MNVASPAYLGGDAPNLYGEDMSSRKRPAKVLADPFSFPCQRSSCCSKAAMDDKLVARVLLQPSSSCAERMPVRMTRRGISAREYSGNGRPESVQASKDSSQIMASHCSGVEVSLRSSSGSSPSRSALPVFQRPAQFFDAPNRIRTARAILRRPAVNYAERRRLTTACAVFRRLSQFSNALHNFRRAE